MKKRIIVITLGFVILAACTPSQKAIRTAIAQTQAAIPTATRTPLPTGTPKPTSTPTQILTIVPSPTLDLRVIDSDPRKLLLKKNHLPPIGKYILPGSGWTSPLTNAEIVSEWTVEEGKAYLAETGRIHGWWVNYKRGTNNARTPEEVYDNVIICSRIEGAQLVVTKYGDRDLIEDGYKEIKAPLIGDISRAFQKSVTNSSGRTRIWLRLIFSYRNVYHTVSLWGWENEIKMVFAIEVADKLIGHLKQLPLSTEVTFTP